MKPSAGATSVKGRARSTYARNGSTFGVRRGARRSSFASSLKRQGDRGGDRRVDEVEHVVVQDTRSFERCAERALDQRAGRGADDDQQDRGDGGSGRAPRRSRRARAPPSRPAAVPSSDIAPGVPGLHAPSVVTRNVDRPQALPISLATVSLPPAVKRRHQRAAAPQPDTAS